MGNMQHSETICRRFPPNVRNIEFFSEGQNELCTQFVIQIKSVCCWSTMSRLMSISCPGGSRERAFTVKVANNGTQAIQLARIEDFDVAVLDLKMDDMDGIEVSKDI